MLTAPLRKMDSRTVDVKSVSFQILIVMPLFVLSADNILCARHII